MVFTKMELSLLVPAIETYLEDGLPNVNPLRKDEVERICRNCIGKLEHLSQLTYFTKKDYSVMSMAVLSIVNSIETVGGSADEETALLNKLFRLRDPNV